VSTEDDSERRRIRNHRFMIDANRINASGRLQHMNQLEGWWLNRVVSIQMAEPAQQEAARGSRDRARKAYGYIYSKTMARTAEEMDLLREIESILFPGGARTEGERRDVEIVFNARKYLCILVTNDGASRRQPGGILGNRDRLRALGIHVCTDEEAVALVRVLLDRRDDLERERSQVTGEPLPDWVGRD
jgi:hypothetical protein